MKRVLVPLTGHASDRRALVTAFQVSERCRGLVDALCIMPHAEVHTPTESTSIPSALLAQLRRIIKQACEEYGVPYIEYPKMRHAVGSHVSFLKQMGRG